MSPNEAKSIIEALANGVDPETGEVLSAQSVFNNGYLCPSPRKGKN